MKYNPGNCEKQTGKVTVVIITNATIPVSTGTKYKDTIYYQVKGHNDYVQEQGG